jgi:hypothetical protein
MSQDDQQTVLGTEFVDLTPAELIATGQKLARTLATISTLEERQKLERRAQKIELDELKAEVYRLRQIILSAQEQRPVARRR